MIRHSYDIYADEGKKGGIIFQSEKSRELIKKLGNVVFAAGSRTELYKEPKIGESRNAFHFMKHHTTSEKKSRLAPSGAFQFLVLSLPHFQQFILGELISIQQPFFAPGWVGHPPSKRRLQ